MLVPSSQLMQDRYSEGPLLLCTYQKSNSKKNLMCYLSSKPRKENKKGADVNCIAADCSFFTWNIHPTHQCLGQRIVSNLVWLANIHNDVGNGVCVHLETQWTCWKVKGV